MPKGKGYKGNSNPDGDKAFSELSKDEQLRRAESAKATATDNLRAARKSGDKKKEAGADKAWSAANRVINRLGGSATSKAGDPGKGGKGQVKAAKKKDKPRKSLSEVAEAAKRAREAKERR